MDFYKKRESHTIWWVDSHGSMGNHEFSFDKKKIYRLFRDYPYNMSKKEIEIFDTENPFWARYFRKRREKWQTESK